MAAKQRKSGRIGQVEYGDVYSELKGPDGRNVIGADGKLQRDQLIGRLIVDFSQDMFYMRPTRGNAIRLSAHDVTSLVANDLIEFDQEDSKRYLTSYLMELDRRKRTVRQAEMNALAGSQRAQELGRETRLQKKVRGKTRTAKFLWTVAMAGFVGLAFVAMIPAPEPAAAKATISGKGQDYGVSSDTVKDATYIEALGSGATLYGVVTDAQTKEVGETDVNATNITENQLINPDVSSNAIHMRPLYYDKTGFRQTQLVANASGGSQTAVYLQNPKGYSLGKAANELVLTGGRGLSSIIVASPAGTEDKSSTQTQQDIEKAQQQAAQEAQGKSTSSSSSKDTDAGKMPDSWNGFDTASIDANRIAASYYYTKDGSNKEEDLRRRIVIFDITSALQSSSSSNSNSSDNSSDSGIAIAQMNYDDDDSNFYNPQIALDPQSNGSTYHIAYTKEDSNGQVGFFIRRIKNNEDILKEEPDTTFSTSDLTGSDSPVTNYRFLGNRLFFEQAGYIWVMNVNEDKLKVKVDGTQRTITKENPIQICKASDIRSSITNDEKQRSQQENKEPTPVAHYTPMAITTDQGREYGIAFVTSDTGNLVFHPIVDFTAASADVNSSTGGNSTANGVMSGDEAAVNKLLEEENKTKSSSDNRNLEGTKQNVPNVIGMNKTDAIKALEDAGFKVKTTGGNGVVLSINPSSTATYGSTITITTGSGASSSGTQTDSKSNGNANAGNAQASDQGGGNATNAQASNASSSNGSGNRAPDGILEGALGGISQGMKAEEEGTKQQSYDGDAHLAPVDYFVMGSGSNANANAGTDANATNGTQVDAENANANDAAPDANANSNAGNGTASTIGGASNEKAKEDAPTGITADTADGGRITIRDVEEDKATVVAFAVRGEQVLWIESDAQTSQRSVRFSPIYYKDKAKAKTEEDTGNVTSALENVNAGEGTGDSSKASDNANAKTNENDATADSTGGNAATGADASVANDPVPSDANAVNGSGGNEQTGESNQQQSAETQQQVQSDQAPQEQQNTTPAPPPVSFSDAE